MVDGGGCAIEGVGDGGLVSMGLPMVTAWCARRLVNVAWSSRSTSRTRRRWPGSVQLRAWARCQALVVLPDPPLWLQMAMIGVGDVTVIWTVIECSLVGDASNVKRDGGVAVSRLSRTLGVGWVSQCARHRDNSATVTPDWLHIDGILFLFGGFFEFGGLFGQQPLVAAGEFAFAVDDAGAEFLRAR